MISDPAAWCYRMILAYDSDSVEACALALDKTVGCCRYHTGQVVMTLVDCLVAVLNNSPDYHDWKSSMALRLAQLLDAMADAEPQ
jgi:hypothetical protein